jgi:hypothetical protein
MLTFEEYVAEQVRVAAWLRETGRAWEAGTLEMLARKLRSIPQEKKRAMRDAPRPNSARLPARLGRMDLPVGCTGLCVRGYSDGTAELWPVRGTEDGEDWEECEGLSPQDLAVLSAPWPRHTGSGVQALSVRALLGPGLRLAKSLGAFTLLWGAPGSGPEPLGGDGAWLELQ